MKKNRLKLKYGLIILSIVLAFILFTGATYNEKSSQIGRYRMSVINRGGFSDIFVIDTATGIVKWVGKDEGKPFEEIKGH